MRVLVTYGSKRGGTEGLAEVIGESLRRRGVTADVEAARSVDHVVDYDAVLVGGALYATRWHKDARRFVRRHTAELRQVPTYLFSSGPLDGSAAEHEIPPTRQVSKLMERVRARGHMTFGGRLAEDAEGFPASKMAESMAGDWRDPDHVDRWVAEVVAELAPVAAAA